jgi:hypothetical protein
MHRPIAQTIPLHAAAALPAVILIAAGAVTTMAVLPMAAIPAGAAAMGSALCAVSPAPFPTAPTDGQMMPAFPITPAPAALVNPAGIAAAIGPGPGRPCLRSCR